MSQQRHRIETAAEKAAGEGRVGGCGAAGFSLVELILIIVISGITVSSLLVGFYSQSRNMEQQREIRLARILADNLMAEIRAKDFVDASLPNSWAEEGANRVNFDDVDDYDGMSNYPPTSVEGAALAGYSRFACRVSVTNVPHDNFNPTGSYPHGSTDFLKISVAVAGPSVVLTNSSVVSKYDL